MFGPTLGANVRVVELPNTTHVTSEGDGTLVAGAGCARAVIRGFVRAPRRLALARHELHVSDPARAHRRRHTRGGWRTRRAADARLRAPTRGSSGGAP